MKYRSNVSISLFFRFVIVGASDLDGYVNTVIPTMVEKIANYVTLFIRHGTIRAYRCSCDILVRGM